MNLFGVQSHLYKKDWWRLHCFVLVFQVERETVMTNNIDNYLRSSVKRPTFAGPCPDDELSTNQKNLQQKLWTYKTLDSF